MSVQVGTNDLTADTMRVCNDSLPADLLPIIEVHMRPSDGVGQATPNKPTILKWCINTLIIK